MQRVEVRKSKRKFPLIWMRHSVATFPAPNQGFRISGNIPSAAVMRRWRCGRTGRRKCGARMTSLDFGHVRFHGLLCDDMGTLVCQGASLFYSFFNADQIFDFLLSIGMKPFVELSFMPSALASGDKTVFHYRANVTPPKDYAQWATLIRKLVAHWVERYGLGEVRQWFFEVWNEPNLDAFGSGKQDDYFKLYRYTAEAIKSIDAR